MFIGVLQFELIVHDSRSLKEKRRVVKSLKDRLHREHLVSIAEVEALDHQRLAVLGLTIVSNSSVHANAVIDRILQKLRGLHGAELGDHTREILGGWSLFSSDDGEKEGLWSSAERRCAPVAPQDAGES